MKELLDKTGTGEGHVDSLLASGTGPTLYWNIAALHQLLLQECLKFSKLVLTSS